MKNIAYLLILFSSIGCRKIVEESTTAIHIYQNNTNHDIEISVSYVKRLDKVNIPAQQSYEGITQGEGGARLLLEGDSAYILFKDPDKYLIYTVTVDSNDIISTGFFNQYNFEETIIFNSEKESKIKRVYTFTDADYESATSL